VYVNNVCVHHLVVLYRWRGPLVYLQSVCLSIWLSFRFLFSGPFSAVVEDILLNFDISLHLLKRYRSSLSFVMLDLLLTELFPLMFIVISDFFFALDEGSNLKYYIRLLLNSYRLSSSFGTFDSFLTELWLLINCDSQFDFFNTPICQSIFCRPLNFELSRVTCIL
jgi:hypothetical protein